MVGNLAENDVFPVEPRSLNGGDEKLGTIGVGTGVCHGKEELLAVSELEVFVGKLLAVDGLPTSTLERRSVSHQAMRFSQQSDTYISASEVAPLQHELGNDTVEL